MDSFAESDITSRDPANETAEFSLKILYSFRSCAEIHLTDKNYLQHTGAGVLIHR